MARIQRSGSRRCERSSTARARMSASSWANLSPRPFDRPISSEDAAYLARAGEFTCRLDAGFAYQAYVRLKLASVRAFGAELIVQAARHARQSPAITRGGRNHRCLGCPQANRLRQRGPATVWNSKRRARGSFPPWVDYLLAFDVKYRERRLQFLIEGQNRLYQLIGQDRFSGFSPQIVDRLKRDLYDRLDAIRLRGNAEFYSDEVARRLQLRFFRVAFRRPGREHRKSYAECIRRRHGDKIDALIQRLAARSI